jgi:hypothetical protein
VLRKSLVAVALAFLACGKRGDPHPPVPVIPQTTSDLVVAQRGARVVLSWSYPVLSTAGQKLGAIRRIVLYRAIEELPAGESPHDLNPALPAAVALFAKVPPIGRQRFTRIRQRLDSMESIPNATAGAKLLYEDAPPFQSADGKPVRIDYALVTEGAKARSDMSNIASVVPVDVAAAPDSLALAPKPEGVVLTWKAPQKTINGNEKPHIVGYNIYRVAKGQPADDMAKPINATPAIQPTYTDVPPFGEQEYWVMAVAAAGPPRIESDASAHATANYKDLLPPPVPTGLTALVETNAVRLVWDAVQAPDFAGYKIYRTEGTGIQELKIVGRIVLTPQLVTQTNFRDIAVEHGISYFYEITSVDKSGNESKPAKTDWVLVPKTP